MKRRPGRLLGTRVLHTAGSTRRVVTVRLGLPRRRGLEEWFCPIQVSGLGNPRIQYVYGEDAIQSVELALQAVRIALEKSRKQLSWFNGEAGVTGFPRSVPYALGPAFSRRVDRLIDREVARFVRGLERRQRRRAGRAASRARGEKVVK